jgi:membrane-associated protease RseP (regulator of RpoE activity)
MGLLGSRHYVTKPILPLERTITMVNLDMVGRLTNGRLHIGGVGTSPVFDGFITKAADGLGLDILRGRGGAAPSDNSPFFRKGMPTLFFFTGIHKDYHRATDHWDTLNYAGFAKTLTVAARVIRSIDALPERPPFVNARTAFLGVQFARGGKGEGAGIARVVPNSPAAKAGMKDGDRVISFAGQPIANTADLSKAIRDRIGGEEVEVGVRRGEETVALRVTLGAR